MNTNTMTIAKKYETANKGHMEEIIKEFIDVYKTLGYHVYKMSDGSLLAVDEASNPVFVKHMEKKKAAKRAKDTKASRYAYVSKYIALFNVDNDRVAANIAIIEHYIVKYDNREDFENAIIALLG